MGVEQLICKGTEFMTPASRHSSDCPALSGCCNQGPPTSTTGGWVTTPPLLCLCWCPWSYSGPWSYKQGWRTGPTHSQIAGDGYEINLALNASSFLISWLINCQLGMSPPRGACLKWRTCSLPHFPFMGSSVDPHGPHTRCCEDE